MLFSVNPNPSLIEFKKLMAKTDELLNKDALARPDYYASRNGNPLEDNVKDALDECAKGTDFEGTIEKISGQRFPDIVAANYYGVEVKSTKYNHWTSTGSSILETTRINGVERIYMTFGKLGGRPIEFLSKPYEECLYGIAVTHMPRYLINMQLNPGETIFEKMNVSYDEIRKMDNPIAPVAQYYKSKLGPDESLWWTGDNSDSTAPPTVKLWSALSAASKEELIVQGYVLFPEILTYSSNKKYNRYALWLVTQKGVVNTNIRDGFSAGGKKSMKTDSGVEVMMPAAFKRIMKYQALIKELLSEIDKEVLEEYWEEEVEDNRIRQWCKLVAKAASGDPIIGYDVAFNVLTAIFPTIKEDFNHKPGFSYPKNSNYYKVANSKALIKGEHLVVCKHCGKKYAQLCVSLNKVYKNSNSDVCPYCHESNGVSLEKVFSNRKIIE